MLRASTSEFYLIIDLNYTFSATDHSHTEYFYFIEKTGKTAWMKHWQNVLVETDVTPKVWLFTTNTSHK